MKVSEQKTYMQFEDTIECLIDWEHKWLQIHTEPFDWVYLPIDELKEIIKYCDEYGEKRHLGIK